MSPSKQRNPPSPRTHVWSVVTYPTDEDLLRLGVDPHITHYAYIVHDKDVLESGEPKEKHVHILIRFSESLSFQHVCNYLQRAVFTSGCTVLVEPMKSRAKAWRYLTHKDNPEKHQYSETDIKTDSAAFWADKASESIFDKPDNDDFLRDLMTASPIQLARKYGRDYIKNFSSYNAFATTFYSAYLAEERASGNSDTYEYDPLQEHKAEQEERKKNAILDGMGYLTAVKKG